MAPNRASQYDTPEIIFTYAEVADNLNVTPDTLHRLSQRFSTYLSSLAKDGNNPQFTTSDIVTLLTIQKLVAQGYDDEQIGRRVGPIHDSTGDHSNQGSNYRSGDQATPTALVTTTVTTGTNRTSERTGDHSGDADRNILNQTRNTRLPETVNPSVHPDSVTNVLDTIVSSQKAVLNGQSTLRDVVGVVVQDNFNLKDENRKLRERMLELERALAEYQRREENRKERIEARTRALESTVAALQQQVAQLVQLHRQQRRRRGWFG